ncbi:PE domain-containing protein [Rhodococcus sp. NPDC058521]|uniref:PE domain-containing protein n=1 Tax=Rhodococcus sp. NPDC058521 TaxID=3346536 RepID=UPI00365FFDD0
MPALNVSPEALIAAAAELDLLAARLQTSVTANSAAIRVLPSGTEEVSLHAAGYFNTVANTFLPAVTQGIAEMQATAATLRQQAATYVAQDLAGGASLDVIM